VIEEIVQAMALSPLWISGSHAISFAILAYASAFLKVHYAPSSIRACSTSADGFYSSATIIKDAKGMEFKL